MSRRERLMGWYRRHGRDLPWRDRGGPYEVLVSEIMLQQTRVETIVPYYRRFLEAFPTLGALAAAPEEAVLARWSGLGYYRRARMLRAAAREIVDRGAFPKRAAELVDLPGIGPYTAAAVASIAFGEAVPAVDGNVERVASRLLALDQDPKRGAAKAAVFELAATLLDPACPGDSNQALMELGALVCRPVSPDCEACPLRQDCLGLEMGIAGELPRRQPRRRIVREQRVLAVVERDGRFLLFRNDDGERLLAGLWEFPSVLRWGRARRGWESDLGASYGGRWKLEMRLGSARHSITHRRLDVDLHSASLEAGGGVAEGAEAGWFSARELREIATTSMVAKVLGSLRMCS